METKVSIREYTKGADMSGFAPGPKRVDLTGQRCGDFVVVCHLGGSRWLCSCVKCGAEKAAWTQAIKHDKVGGTCRQCRGISEPSGREREVMALVAQGMTSKQIAAELSISDR